MRRKVFAVLTSLFTVGLVVAASPGLAASLPGDIFGSAFRDLDADECGRSPTLFEQTRQRCVSRRSSSGERERFQTVS